MKEVLCNGQKSAELTSAAGLNPFDHLAIQMKLNAVINVEALWRREMRHYSVTSEPLLACDDVWAHMCRKAVKLYKKAF